MGFSKICFSAALVLLACAWDRDRIVAAKSVFNQYRTLRQLDTSDQDVGQPLILSSFIENGQIAEGQAAAKVKPIVGTVESYAGYFTVNKTYNSNLFFWFFPAQRPTENTPVALWLNGGPGVSSLMGLFREHGPYFISKKGQVKLRAYSWTREFSMLYIDSPAGTGFSFTEDDRGYATDQTQVGADLYSALFQFFQLFPQYKDQDFYVTGESYAGKYAPAVAYAIHTRNPTAPFKINLKGLAIGNGLVDPENMMGHYGDYLYQIGLLDANGLADFRKAQDLTISLTKQSRWTEATTACNKMFGEFSATDSIFYDVSGFTYFYNHLYATEPPLGNFEAFVRTPEARVNLHVGNVTFVSSSEKVAKYLNDDIMKSVRPWVEELLAHYKVLFYSGQLDIIVAYPLTIGFLQALKFDAAEEYAKAPRQIWRVKGAIAGYAKVAGNLTEVLVRDAGHLVPTDQPIWALDMMKRFTNNKDWKA